MTTFSTAPTVRGCPVALAGLDFESTRTYSLLGMTDPHAPARLSAAQIEYLASQRLGRLATAGADHRPHVVPTSFRYNPALGTVDIGGIHVADTKKFRDVQANGFAALVVDDLVSVTPWRARFLEIRGRAEAIPSGGAHLGPGFGDAFIRLHPERVVGVGVE
jgi:pyridoxamine 5'-phosphate oxidase family protein